VAGWISHAGDVIEVLDVTALTAPLDATSAPALAGELAEALP
jgi:hypothetical protein